MDLSIYDIIKGPVVSDKAQKVNSSLKKLVLTVHPHSNKPLVKEAIEKLFNVKVDNIRIVVRKGKTKRAGKRIIVGKLQKRAIVTLKEGYTVDLFGHSGSQSVVDSQESAG